MEVEEKQLKIIVVEDDVIIARLIEEHLLEAGYQVIGVEHNGDRALDLIHNQQPDLVLLDINIDGSKDGIEVGEEIKAKYELPFIFLTALSDLGTIERAKKARPCGYLVKPYKASDLYSTIAIGMYNFASRYIPESELTLEKVNQIAVDNLTEREFEVLIDITQGFTNAQISEKQHLSLSTVKWHLQNIYSKLGVKNRTSAVRLVLG